MIPTLFWKGRRKGIDIDKIYTYLVRQLDNRDVIELNPCTEEEEMSQKAQVGNGIRKNSARPIEIHVDTNGEYWICDKGADVSGFDFRSAGCAPHSEVHLVK
jgi:hypothetical protein